MGRPAPLLPNKLLSVGNMNTYMLILADVCNPHLYIVADSVCNLFSSQIILIIKKKAHSMPISILC